MSVVNFLGIPSLWVLYIVAFASVTPTYNQWVSAFGPIAVGLLIVSFIAYASEYVRANIAMRMMEGLWQEVDINMRRIGWLRALLERRTPLSDEQGELVVLTVRAESIPTPPNDPDPPVAMAGALEVDDPHFTVSVPA